MISSYAGKPRILQNIKTSKSSSLCSSWDRNFCRSIIVLFTRRTPRCQLFLAKIHTKISHTHTSSWHYWKPSNVIHIFHDISRHTNSRTKTACYLKIAKCKNNSFVKSVLTLLKRGTFSEENAFESVSSPRRIASLQSDRFNQRLRHYSVNYRIIISTRTILSSADHNINSIRPTRVVERCLVR